MATCKPGVTRICRPQMSKGRWGECYPNCSSTGNANKIPLWLSWHSNSTCPALAGSIISKDQQSLLVTWNCKSTENQDRIVLWFFKIIHLPLLTSSFSLILIFRVLHLSLILLLATGTTKEKIRGEKEDHSLVCQPSAWARHEWQTSTTLFLSILVLQWEDRTNWLSADWCKCIPEFTCKLLQFLHGNL